MKLIRNSEKSEPLADEAMRRWAAIQREQLLEDRLDRLTTTLEQLVAVLGRPSHE